MIGMGRRSLLTTGACLAASAVTSWPPSALAATLADPATKPPTILDNAALQTLTRRSKETKSDAVIVYHRGVKIFDYYSGKPEPIFLMSCTKSICSLAVGRAIADGKIKSIDQPVYDFYPEMKQGRKAAMTVRHLLSMTSGIQNNGTGGEVYPAPNWVRLALAAELTTAPGVAFEYNNKAVNLLSGIIHLATKQPLDDYVAEQFFIPMEIKSWNWWRDDDGNASAMADLALFPEDFAKFGQLMLQNGVWNGKPLVPADWVKQSGMQSQPYEPLYGLLWWRTPAVARGVLTQHRIDDLAKAGLKPGFIAALNRLAGKTFKSGSDWHQALQSAFPTWEAERLKYIGVIDSYASDIPVWRYSQFDGVQAEGYLGQYLVILPQRDIVAVRMIKPFPEFTFNQNRFEDFADTVRMIVPAV